ncbi:membrane progestin receptor alpha isoform X3 [Corvus moneduloides]|uniref:membrane progestin receptor alpha isoform X3 n=1 Tax=Corvus moneduloides TaxID=1196302 RepID=UPI001363B72A|nr:membrane progestin receptor alpha isoform X3 [Corvus moneduloides]
MRGAWWGRGRRERETGTGKKPGAGILGNGTAPGTGKNREREFSGTGQPREREKTGSGTRERGSPGSPGMRRRRGGGAAPAEACGVWLDTAELKRGPARPPSAKIKAPTRVPERKRTPVLLPQPGTKQTTIPTFFSSHTDERDKENSRPTPCTPNKDCKDTGVPLAACPVKILALPQLEGAREEPSGAEQGVQSTSRAWQTPLEPPELQMESESQSKASRGAGGDSWCCSFSQGSEYDGIIAPRNKSWLFPEETASGSRKPQHWSRVNSGMGFAGTENTNPVPGAAPRGVCSSPLKERGQNTVGAQGGSCRELFSQDSQGNRVIAHRATGSSSPRQSQPRGLQLGSEALFTQDSEGNRVIKHW